MCRVQQEKAPSRAGKGNFISCNNVVTDAGRGYSDLPCSDHKALHGVATWVEDKAWRALGGAELGQAGSRRGRAGGRLQLKGGGGTGRFSKR